MTEGIDRAANRALFYSLGLKREDLCKPLIAIVNCSNDIVPGWYCKNWLQMCKTRCNRSWWNTFEFNTIAVCDGMLQGHIGMRYSLPRGYYSLFY